MLGSLTVDPNETVEELSLIEGSGSIPMKESTLTDLESDHQKKAS